MMKEVCSQCLQRHVDPETGKEEFIFSCYNQDHELDRVDFDNSRRGFARTASRRSSRISGSSMCWIRLNGSSFTYKLLRVLSLGALDAFARALA